MNEPLMRKSTLLGALLGAVFGGLIGAGLGATTLTLSGTFVGGMIGLVLGLVTGTLTAALTVKTAGTQGGIGVGYFTGMVFGGVFGMILGFLIPTSLRMSAHTERFPMLDALMMGRFETAMLTSFLLSVVATMVGAWVAGRNFAPRDVKVNGRARIDQFDLVEVIGVPERHEGVIDVGDIGAVLEIYDNGDFEIECLRPDGSYKWLETLNRRYVRLKSKIPDNM
jgi:hypothetical protein